MASKEKKEIYSFHSKKIKIHPHKSYTNPIKVIRNQYRLDATWNFQLFTEILLFYQIKLKHQYRNERNSFKQRVYKELFDFKLSETIYFQ